MIFTKYFLEFPIYVKLVVKTNCSFLIKVIEYFRLSFGLRGKLFIISKITN